MSKKISWVQTSANDKTLVISWRFISIKWHGMSLVWSDLDQKQVKMAEQILWSTYRCSKTYPSLIPLSLLLTLIFVNKNKLTYTKLTLEYQNVLIQDFELRFSGWENLADRNPIQKHLALQSKLYPIYLSYKKTYWLRSK